MQFVSRFIILTAIFLGVGGCGTDVIESELGRGSFTLMGDDTVSSKFVKIKNEKITGHACSTQIQEGMFGDNPVIQWAVWSALSSHPDATVLIDVSVITEENDCVRVTGYPARYKLKTR